MVGACGATLLLLLLFLPPYSPDLNPTEAASAKPQRLLRPAGHRTADALWPGVRHPPDRIPASDAANSFRHCGYTPQVQ